eukprot:1912058-Prorocentrum_lima.AAC.1
MTQSTYHLHYRNAVTTTDTTSVESELVGAGGVEVVEEDPFHTSTLTALHLEIGPSRLLYLRGGAAGGGGGGGE